MEEKYVVHFGDTSAELDLVKTDKVSYYSFNLLGNRRLNHLVAKCLFEKIRGNCLQIDAVITVEAKAIGLAQELSGMLELDRYVVVRKSVKNYMKNPVILSENTFISGTCNYVIDQADLDYLSGKNILVVDDVVSTGGTISAILKMLEVATPENISIACALTEGEQRKSFKGIPIISCDHIPVFLS